MTPYLKKIEWSGLKIRSINPSDSNFPEILKNFLIKKKLVIPWVSKCVSLGFGS
jgi:hypothetical protein